MDMKQANIKHYWPNDPTQPVQRPPNTAVAYPPHQQFILTGLHWFLPSATRI